MTLLALFATTVRRRARRAPAAQAEAVPPEPARLM
jgi:hypothetical protein